MSRFYALTVKCNYKKPVWMKDYWSAIYSNEDLLWPEHYALPETAFEVDSKGKLHLHAVLQTDYRVDYKVIQRPGHQFYLKLLKTGNDLLNWSKYINKCQTSLTNLEDCYFPPYNSQFYKFID